MPTRSKQDLHVETTGLTGYAKMSRRSVVALLAGTFLASSMLVSNPVFAQDSKSTLVVAGPRTPESLDQEYPPTEAVHEVRRNVYERLLGYAAKEDGGSGKTTVGQCLVKLLKSDSGQIKFDDQDTVPISEKAFRPLRRRIQMVFQEPYVALNPRWTASQLLAEPLRLELGLTKAAKIARVRELLGLVQLPAKLADSYPHELTAGEQKRIGIARALATKPEFVVFDEPTTALDIRVRAHIIDLVRDLQREIGLSALFITHDLNSVRSLAHYVAVMRLGKIVETGETERIFANPQHEYTQKLLAAELPIEQNETQRARAQVRQLKASVVR